MSTNHKQVFYYKVGLLKTTVDQLPKHERLNAHRRVEEILRQAGITNRFDSEDKAKTARAELVNHGLDQRCEVIRAMDI